MVCRTDFGKNEKKAGRRRSIWRAICGTMLTFWALIVLFPFYWMILTSVKSYGSYNAERMPRLFTLEPTLQNYRDAFTSVPLAGYLANTLIFTAATTAIMILVIVLSAYAFARLNFRGKNILRRKSGNTDYHKNKIQHCKQSGNRNGSPDYHLKTFSQSFVFTQNTMYRESNHGKNIYSRKNQSGIFKNISYPCSLAIEFLRSMAFFLLLNFNYITGSFYDIMCW